VNFDLGEEQRMIQETARRVGADFGVDYWRAKDAAHEFPGELWRAVCDTGLCGIALPEAYGGSGLGMLELVLAIEELAAAGAGSTVGQLFILNPVFGGVALAEHGQEAARREYLPKMVAGEMRFCMALTEPDAGVNTTHIKTFAERTSSGWKINGRKIWITAVPDSHKMLVVARTRKLEEVERKTHGISLFMIDTQRKGLTCHPIDKLGTHTLSSSSVFFDDVEVTEDELVGTEHMAWVELFDVLNTERLVTTAAAIGSARLAIRLGVEYANQRRVFGNRAISSYQGVQFPLAEAHAMLSCAREMNFKAAWLCDNKRPYATEANTAKYLAAEALAQATERAMHSMGGMGFARESHVERLWRDARLSQFAPVPQEMILNFIAMHDLGMPRSY